MSKGKHGSGAREIIKWLKGQLVHLEDELFVLDLFCGDGSWQGIDFYASMPNAHFTHADRDSEKLWGLPKVGKSQRFFTADFQHFLGDCMELHRTYEFIVCDNPALASSGASFEKVLPKLARVVEPGGVLIFNFGVGSRNKKFKNNEQDKAYGYYLSKIEKQTGLPVQHATLVTRNKKCGIYQAVIIFGGGKPK